MSALARHPVRIENLHIKYNVVYRPYKKRRIKSSNIYADVTFDLPDAPANWRIVSAVDEDIANIPNIKSAHAGDTVINSPSDEWQMQVSGVRLLSHIGECLMRSGSHLGPVLFRDRRGLLRNRQVPRATYTKSRAVRAWRSSRCPNPIMTTSSTSATRSWPAPAKWMR